MSQRRERQVYALERDPNLWFDLLLTQFDVENPFAVLLCNLSRGKACGRIQAVAIWTTHTIITKSQVRAIASHHPFFVRAISYGPSFFHIACGFNFTHE
jgi:hypothetical protein